MTVRGARRAEPPTWVLEGGAGADSVQYRNRGKLSPAGTGRPQR